VEEVVEEGILLTAILAAAAALVDSELELVCR